MKKTYVISTILIIIIGIILFYNFTNVSSKDSTNMNISKVSENTNLNSTSKIKEIELAKFSTKILSQDPNRQNNLNITCRTLDNYIVKAGETFSFTNIIGPSTPEKGYQEADIFDSNRK